MKVVSSLHPSVPAVQGERRESTVNGTRTCYWTYGPQHARPAVVMVHGFRGDHHGLEPVIACLSGYRVVAPDLPGFGESARFASTRHSVDAYAGWLAFEASAGDDVSEYAARIGVPVLLVGGDRDDITPVAVHRRLLSMFPHAKLVRLAGVGHLIHYETPDQAAQAIRTFLEADR